jgi:hypothetical protein
VLGFSIVATEINSFVSDEKLHPSQQILLHDLVAISIQSETILLPPYIISRLPGISVSDLQRLYTTRDLAPMFWGDVSPHFDEHITDQEFAELVTTWLRTVPTHLSQYLTHRGAMFSHLLAIDVAQVCFPIYTGPVVNVENVLGFSPAGQAVNAALTGWLGGITDSLLFRGWFYLVLSAALLLSTLVARRARTLFGVTLALSGLVYGLTYLPLAPSCELRYLWWTMLTTVLFPITLLLPDASQA